MRRLREHSLEVVREEEEAAVTLATTLMYAGLEWLHGAWGISSFLSRDQSKPTMAEQFMFFPRFFAPLLSRAKQQCMTTPRVGRK